MMFKFGMVDVNLFVFGTLTKFAVYFRLKWLQSEAIHHTKYIVLQCSTDVVVALYFFSKLILEEANKLRYQLVTYSIT